MRKGRDYMSDHLYCEEEQVLDFTIPVEIPVGFVIISPNRYTKNLTLEQSNLHQIRTIDDILADECQSYLSDTRYGRARKFFRPKRLRLYGSIGYNLALGEFRPAKLVQGENVTSFTANGRIPINLEVEYRGIGDITQIDQKAFEDLFSIQIIRHTEFVVNECGEAIPLSYRQNSQFFKELRSPGYARMVYIPYTLIITPKRFRV